jgi:3-hydroxyisobutyrate dehydrogenase
VVDTSTVPPRETKSMAAKLAKKGIEWMDVPISGAANQAKVGNMVFMAGGRKATFGRVKPVLDKIGKKTVYVGKNGDAALLKLVVNHTLFLNQAAAVEGLTLGLKAGLNPEVMLDVLTSGATGSDLLTARGKDMVKAISNLRGHYGWPLKISGWHWKVPNSLALYSQLRDCTSSFCSVPNMQAGMTATPPLS